MSKNPSRSLKILYIAGLLAIFPINCKKDSSKSSKDDTAPRVLPTETPEPRQTAEVEVTGTPAGTSTPDGGSQTATPGTNTGPGATPLGNPELTLVAGAGSGIVEQPSSFVASLKEHATSFALAFGPITFPAPSGSTAVAPAGRLLTALESSAQACVNEVFNELKFQVTEKSSFQMVEGKNFETCMNSKSNMEKTISPGAFSATYSYSRNLKVLCQNADFTPLNGKSINDSEIKKGLCLDSPGGTYLANVVTEVSEKAQANGPNVRVFRRTRAVQAPDGKPCTWTLNMENNVKVRTYSECIWIDKVETETLPLYFLKSNLAGLKLAVNPTSGNRIVAGFNWESMLWNGSVTLDGQGTPQSKATSKSQPGTVVTNPL